MSFSQWTNNINYWLTAIFIMCSCSRDLEETIAVSQSNCIRYNDIHNNYNSILQFIYKKSTFWTILRQQKMFCSWSCFTTISFSFLAAKSSSFISHCALHCGRIMSTAHSKIKGFFSLHADCVEFTEFSCFYCVDTTENLFRMSLFMSSMDLGRSSWWKSAEKCKITLKIVVIHCFIFFCSLNWILEFQAHFGTSSSMFHSDPLISASPTLMYYW